MTDERVLADTNVLIHHINGDERVEQILQDRIIHISFVTEVELLSFPGYVPKEREAVKAWLKGFIINGAERAIRSIVVDLRVRFRMKLADAFVAATAAYLDIPLITEDKHFKRQKGAVDLWMIEE